MKYSDMYPVHVFMMQLMPRHFLLSYCRRLSARSLRTIFILLLFSPLFGPFGGYPALAAGDAAASPDCMEAPAAGAGPAVTTPDSSGTAAALPPPRFPAEPLSPVRPRSLPLDTVPADNMPASVAPPIESPADPPLPMIPEALLPFTADHGPEHALLVDKSRQILFLYRLGPQPEEVARYACSTGKSRGRKEQDGDARTPEGVYYFTRIFEDGELSPIYGIRAFPMDYPNLLDRISRRTGSAIWLHATNKKLIDRDSNGCVAVTNETISALTPYIRLHDTPVIVAEELRLVGLPEARRAGARVEELVSEWIRALGGGTYHDYLSFYDPGFVPDISWWADWRNRRTGSAGPLTVAARRIRAFRYGDTITALFSLIVRSRTRETRAGLKKLFIREINGKLRIIADTWQQPVPPPPPTDPGPPSVLIAAVVSSFPENAEDKAAAAISATAVPEMVDQWLTAWSAKDIQAYGSHYAADFQSRGMDKSAFLKFKEKLNEKYKFIRVSRGHLSIRQRPDGNLAVSFLQKYESSGHSGSGRKILTLKPEHGQWKIYREIWKQI